MNTRQRIEKLEESIAPPSMAVIVVSNDESIEDAYAQAFPDGIVKPRTIIYISELDALC